ncbi:MAG: trigger factor [Planctomycetota bacterium]
MIVTVEDVAPCRKRLSVELDAAEVDAAFDASLAEVRQAAQLPGFRRGCVPPKVIERRFGERIADEVKGKLFQKGLSDALKEKELSPLGAPDAKLDDLALSRGAAFRFSTEIDVRPKFPLAEYRGIELAERVLRVSEAEIDARVEELRGRFADHKPVEEPARVGDLLEGAVTFRAGETEIFQEKERALRVEGSTLFGIEVGDLVKPFAGATAGETRTLSFPMPADYPREDLRGQEAVVAIRVARVLRAELPAADEAFAKRLGLDSVEALRGELRRSLEADRAVSAREALERALADRLIAVNPFELPIGLVERQAEARLARQKLELVRSGVPLEFLEKNDAEMKEASREGSERQIRRMIVFDAIAEKEKVSVTEADLQRHLQALAARYRTTPAKMLRHIQQENGLAAMEEEIRDIKVTRLLLDAARIAREEVDAGPEAAADRT